MFVCTCLYCDKKWEARYRWQAASCPKCKSKDPKVKTVDTDPKIDYYGGSKPFPKEKQIDEALELIYPSTEGY